MNISRTPSISQTKTTPSPQPQRKSGPDLGELAADVAFIGAGALPVVGAGVNLMTSIGSGFNGKEAVGNLAGVGMFVNLAGSATLATGLMIGNQTATQVGLGMLGFSAFTVGAGVVARGFY